MAAYSAAAARINSIGVSEGSMKSAKWRKIKARSVAAAWRKA